MHDTLINIKIQLNNTIAKLDSAIPSNEPFGFAHGNWSFPNITKSELAEDAKSIVDLIDAFETDDLGDAETIINDYIRRLTFLQSNTIPNLWSNPPAGIAAYQQTLTGLKNALNPILVKDNKTEHLKALRDLTNKLRSMESRVRGLEPRTGTLETMVARIENAYHAADQLPTDLETLSEAREKILALTKYAETDYSNIKAREESAAICGKSLQNSLKEAQAVLDRCETAYSAATSVGLAAAFNERSDTLSKSMWLWVFGLISALIAGSIFGARQLHTLSELFKLPDPSTSIIILNLFLSLLSIGAPVWFSWLATKQIGQRFRLAEDYAFKASISRAYEGFRREAARFDKDMEAKLLNSALARLDELPLRLVEPDSHGSPWHELASSEVVKQAMAAVPGFAEQVKDLASVGVATLGQTRRKHIKPATNTEAETSE